MRSYIVDVGVLYDTLLYLSRCLVEGSSSNDSGYVELRQRLEPDTIPQMLYPLICRHQGTPSFLERLLFVGRPFAACSPEQSTNILNNRSYLYQRFVEYFFPQHDTSKVRKAIASFSQGLTLMKQYQFDPTLELYVYYAALHFDSIVTLLKDTFWTVYDKVKKLHEQFISDTETSLEPSSTEIAKLRAISASGGKGNSYRFSLSMMEPEAISFCAKNPAFFLLGCDYKRTLDEKYRYANITPFTLAQALGNEVKYEIYQALLQKPSMSRAELERALMMSRAALEHNLGDMRNRGLVVIDRQQGNAYYYKINPEFVRITANTLLAGVRDRL